MKVDSIVKLALISDIHANLEALDSVIADARACDVEGFACLGDIVGYGADPVACVERVRGLDPVAVIQGNHDICAADDSELVRINPLARDAILWTRRQLDAGHRAWLAGLPYTAEPAPDVTLVHASNDEPRAWHYVRLHREGARALRDQPTRLCFYGHTHMPLAFRQTGEEIELFTLSRYDLSTGDRWLVNVGSVGQPRDGDPRAAWSLLDLSAQRLTMRRVEYDIAGAKAKIVAAGLPPHLAERLDNGH